MKSPAQRKADQRQRDKDAGLVHVTVKVPVARKKDLLEFARQLNSGDKAMTAFNLKDEEKFHCDLVARVLHTADNGGVNHDTDITYLVRGNGPFSERDSVTEDELKTLIESEGEHHGTSVFFIRWEEPGEWSML